MKFDDKLKIKNFIRNHPSFFQSNTHHLDEVLTNLGLIRSFFHSISNMLVIVQNLKIIAGPDL